MSNLIFKPALLFEYSKTAELPPFWVTHTKAWANVIEKTFPHIKGYIASDSKTIDSECSFLPIYQIKKPFKKASWLSIPYATISDPVLNAKCQIGTFLESLVQHPEIKNSSLEIRTLKRLEKPDSFMECAGYVNHQIQLSGESEQELFGRFHKTAVQKHIRKSLESGISLKTGSNIEDVKEFYRVYVLMRKLQGLFPQPFAFFRNMWNELSPHGMVELLLAEKDGKVISGLWSLKNKYFYSFEYLAQPQKNDKYHSTHFLYWHGIKNALYSGIKTVSFARTSVGNEGLNLFKQRWGTETLPYYDLKYPSCTTESSRESSTYYKLMRKYSSKLPLPVFRLLGEIVYRLV